MQTTKPVKRRYPKQYFARGGPPESQGLTRNKEKHGNNRDILMLFVKDPCKRNCEDGVPNLCGVDLKTEKPSGCDTRQFQQEEIIVKKYIYPFAAITIVLLLCPLSVLSAEVYKTESPGNTLIQFSDPNFETAVRSIIGKLEGEILASDVVGITELNVAYRDIADLQGIEYFTGLNTLICTGNRLTKLDVSRNPALQVLHCYGSELTELDISGATALKKLNCANNRLTTLDTSKNLALEVLACEGNQVTMLDLKKNVALEDLDCSFNQLTMLELGKNTALTYIRCIENRLKSLDISQCVALKVLHCSSNELTTLDTKKNTALLMLYCGDNQLTSLDMSHNVKLWLLSCYRNRLEYLNLQGLTALEKVNWNDNLFSDISSIIRPDGETFKNIELGPQGKSDDKGAEMSPKESLISDVAVEFPDLNFEAEIRRILRKPTGDIMMSDIAVITRLIVSGLEIKDLTGIEHFVLLEELDCKRNQLVGLDVSHNTLLKSLDCSWNQLETLDVSQNVSLERLSCENNRLTSLDATKNTALSALCCYNNLFPDDSAITVSEVIDFFEVVVSIYSNSYDVESKGAGPW